MYYKTVLEGSLLFIMTADYKIHYIIDTETNKLYKIKENENR